MACFPRVNLTPNMPCGRGTAEMSLRPLCLSFLLKVGTGQPDV